MIPINNSKDNCTPTSSNCVKWPAIELESVDVCRDASLTEVIIALSDKLKGIIDALDVDTYELKCLENAKCGPQEFNELVQLIINKLCELQQNKGVDLSAVLMNIEPECFININGDRETDIPSYANLIATEVCKIYEQIAVITETINDISEKVETHTEQIEALQNKQDALEFQNCDGTDAGNAQEFLQSRSNSLCDIERIVGEVSRYQNLEICNINEPYANFLSDNTPISPSIVDNNTIFGNIKNIWTLLCDVRKKVYDMSNSMDKTELVIQAFRLCNGSMYYRITNSYDTDKYTLSSPVITCGTQSFTPEITSGWHTDSSLDLTEEKNYQANYGATFLNNYGGANKEQNVDFIIRKAVTDIQINGNIISFTKNIEKTVELYREHNGTRGTAIKTFPASTTGYCEYVETADLVPGETYTYVVVIDSNDCLSLEYTKEYPDPVNPSISNGAYVNDSDYNNQNTVEPGQYSAWRTLYEP